MGLSILLLAAAQAAALQPSDQLRFDIQCMIASQTAAEKLDGAAKGAVELATMFYFGRVDSVISGDALESQIEAIGKTLEGKPLGPLLQQCGEFMQTRGKVLQEIGERLDAREKARELR